MVKWGYDVWNKLFAEWTQCPFMIKLECPHVLWALHSGAFEGSLLGCDMTLCRWAHSSWHYEGSQCLFPQGQGVWERVATWKESVHYRGIVVVDSVCGKLNGLWEGPWCSCTAAPVPRCWMYSCDLFWHLHSRWRLSVMYSFFRGCVISYTFISCS